MSVHGYQRAGLALALFFFKTRTPHKQPLFQDSLIGEQVFEGVSLFCCRIEGAEDFELHIPAEFAALAGTRDHLVRNLLRGGSDKVMRFQIVLF